jgi:hypothetical protein
VNAQTFLAQKRNTPLRGRIWYARPNLRPASAKVQKNLYLYVMPRVKISPAIRKWERWRAAHVMAQFPQLENWLKGEKHPALKQSEKLTKKAYIP